MPIKDIFREKLPREVKESPEFNSLLSLISREEIKSIAELNVYLDKEIKAVRDWLSSNKGPGTMSRLRREKVKKLEFLEIIKREVMRYL
jgi:predicted transcriptional regulator